MTKRLFTEPYKDQNEVTSMEWPAQSPDLNMIENIWLYMKRELQKSAVDIAIKNDLLREIQSVWGNIGLYEKPLPAVNIWPPRQSN